MTIEVCPKCGNRLLVCGCTFTLEERRKLLKAPERPYAEVYGSCGDDIQEAFSAMRARRDEIHAERLRLAELGFEQRFAYFAYANQTENELKAIDRDLFQMTWGKGSACRKGRRASPVGVCRDCSKLSRGLALVGYVKAYSITREPGDELEPWVQGWIAGLDGITECGFTGRARDDWEWWRSMAVELLEGKTRSEIRSEISEEKAKLAEMGLT